MTEKTKTFAEKLSAALEDIGSVAKDARNDHHRYDYTSAAAVQRTVQRALSKHGLFLSSESAVVDSVPYTTRSGASGVRITMRTAITVSDGSASATGVGYGCGQDTEDKAPMKAQTASYKYALCALFCIGMGDDPERQDEDAPPPKTATPNPQPAAATKEPSVGEKAKGELLSCTTKASIGEWCKRWGAWIDGLEEEPRGRVVRFAHEIGDRFDFDSVAIDSLIAEGARQ